jgi:UDP-glucose 4-epimerase
VALPDGLPGRVAVTGGAGFIGSHTVELLDRAGARVLVIDDESHACGHPAPAGVETLVADAGTEEAARALADFRPEAVLHLASKGGVERARRDPAGHVRTSVASSVALFHAAVAAGAQRIVTASSGGTIYGRTQGLPSSERLGPAPISAYAAGKLAEEGYLASLQRLHGVSTMALRYGNVYGPRQDGTGEAGVVAITCTRLGRDEAPIVYGDGGQTRDFIYVEDVATANVAALGSERTGALNVGTGVETAIRALVLELVRLSGRRLRVDQAPAREGEVRRVCLDSTRARAWLGWSPRTEVRVGLKATLTFFCKDSASFRKTGVDSRS